MVVNKNYTEMHGQRNVRDRERERERERETEERKKERKKERRLKNCMFYLMCTYLYINMWMLACILTYLSIFLHTNNQNYLCVHLTSEITPVCQEFLLCSLRNRGTLFCDISEIRSSHMKIKTALRTCHWKCEIDITRRH